MRKLILITMLLSAAAILPAVISMKAAAEHLAAAHAARLAP